MLVKARLVGDLTSPKINPAAARADIRAPRTPAARAVAAPPTMGTAVQSSEFESMLAISDAQGQIIDEVLDGPVSQQTQRQLARLKENNSRGQLARELRQGRTPALAEALLKNHALDENKAASESAKGVPEGDLAAQLQASAQISAAAVSAEAAAAQNLARVNRRPANLSAGLTIAAGVETGRIFSPSQLTSFKQRNGLSLAPGRLAAAAAYSSQELRPQGAADWNAANGAKRLTRGANFERESAEALADPGVKSSEEMVKESDQAAKKPQGLSGSDIDTIVNKVGQALGLDPSLIKAVIKTESNFNHRAVSPAGAQGLMQLMPGTAREMGVKDPFSPLDNIWGGARYL
ncbi:MAG: lytic transglycosylase domain-containing protein, partial [Deltaproteobacteria bacterium]|nr:lytic transglycosylase domain-containing protein [Deltaproteobacteria bacterium]